MRVILDGPPEGEHLWANVRPDGVTFGLHTMNITRTDSSWREVNLASVSWDALDRLQALRRSTSGRGDE